MSNNMLELEVYTGCEGTIPIGIYVAGNEVCRIDNKGTTD